MVAILKREKQENTFEQIIVIILAAFNYSKYLDKRSNLSLLHLI